MGKYKCVSDCIMRKNPYSYACASCFADLTKCTKDHCMFKCMSGPDSKPCSKCVRKHCNPQFVTCSGYPASDLPSSGKTSGSLLNIEGTLTLRRMKRDQMRQDAQKLHGTIFNAAGRMVSSVDTIKSQMSGMNNLEATFKDRPICRDDNEIIQKASDGKITFCSQISDICNDPEFGPQLRIACPLTCNSLSKKCNDCNDKDSILIEATHGKLSSCQQVRSSQETNLCDDREFGGHLQQACPVTCDSCGVVFQSSTPAPVRKSESADELAQSQLILLTKVNDGTLVEDAVTQSIKVSTQNPRGPHNAVDGWGYGYASVTLTQPELTVKIEPGMIPIVWHRPVGFPFNFRNYNPYRDGNNKQTSGGSGDDDGRSRRLQVEEDFANADAANEPTTTIAGGYQAVEVGTDGYQAEPPYEPGYYPGYTSGEYPTEKAFIHTTLAHVEFPHYTFKPGMNNYFVAGVSAHVTKHWIDTNRDWLERVAFPIAAPKVKEQLEGGETPVSFQKAFLAQFELWGKDVDFKPIPRQRPEPPTCVLTFGGTLSVSASYRLLTVSADINFMCTVKMVASIIGDEQKVPKFDCGKFKASNVKNRKFLHNLWFLGASLGIAFFLTVFIWWIGGVQGICCGNGGGAEIFAMGSAQLRSQLKPI